jgi:proteasome lid subunit RPN8/RPN11
MSKDAVKVRIAEKDWNRLMTYLRSAKPDEIIGLGHAEIKDGAILVYDPFILEQEVGPATCEIAPKALVKFISEHDKIDRVKCIWHSHVEMTARFSTCDRDTSNTLAAIGAMMSGPNSWWVSIVINLKQEYECVVDMYTPFRATLPCELFVFNETDPGIENEVKTLVHRSSEKWKHNQEQHSHETGPYSGSVVVRGGRRKGNGGTPPPDTNSGGGAKTDHDTKRYTEEDVFGAVDLTGGDGHFHHGD